MGSTSLTPGTDPFMEAVKRTLEADVREALRAPLMEQAEHYVDAAVDKAVAELKIKLDSWADHFDMSATLKVVYVKKEPTK